MFAGASLWQLLPYSSPVAIGSFLEQCGMMVWGLEQLQPFYKCEGENLVLPAKGFLVNEANFVEGRAEKPRKTQGLVNLI